VNHKHTYDEYGFCFECDKPEKTNITRLINRLRNPELLMHMGDREQLADLINSLIALRHIHSDTESEC
jgi:hypothetical protein